MKAVVYSFTRRGARLSTDIGEVLQKINFEVRCLTMPKFAEEKIFLEAMDDHNKACEYAFKECQLIVFVGAVGIAVRTIAPYIKNKLVDPAVLSVDEGGNFVIPLLSGHIGGANGFAKALGKDLDERIVWESIRSMANKLNMSPTAVSECIKHLESAGLLKVQRANSRSSTLPDDEDSFFDIDNIPF